MYITATSVLVIMYVAKRKQLKLKRNKMVDIISLLYIYSVTSADDAANTDGLIQWARVSLRGTGPLDKEA